jgi:arginyl-tRNA synthetase
MKKVFMRSETTPSREWNMEISMLTLYGRNVSIELYITTYARLNITFDDYSGEWQVKPARINPVERKAHL